MKPRLVQIFVPLTLGLVTIGLFASWQPRYSVADEPSKGAAIPAVAKDKAAKSDAEAIARVSLPVARDRARLLHEVYTSTLEVMHSRYFHHDRAIVPARALEDVFRDMKRHSQSEARWIAVSLKAMSVDHEPKTDFEKRSAREIKGGQREVETVEDGYYRRAVAISLHGGCVHCHAGSFRQTSPSSMFAGLVISIPIEQGESLDSAESVQE